MQGEEATMQEMHERLTQTERNIPNQAGKEYEDVLMVSKRKSLNGIGIRNNPKLYKLASFFWDKKHD